MQTMNVTAKYSNGAVHRGGVEMHGGRWSPACGIQRDSGGGRTPKALYPTDKAVTCKRCLKKIEKREAEQPKQAPAANPGRCLERVAKVGKTPTQCVNAHAHTGDHEDRFGQTFPNRPVPRVERAASAELARLNAPKGSAPKRPFKAVQDAIGLRW